MSWPLVKLGELADILSGYAFKSSLFNTDNVGLPLIRIRDVVDGKSDTFYSGEYSKEFLIDDGDLLIGMDGDFNREIWNGGQALLNQRVCKITANGVDLDQRYLYHFLPKELLRIHASTPAVTVKHLSVKVLRDIDLPLPPLEEQKRIAAILDKADAIRRKRQQAIKLADDFLRSVFLEMFGDPVTNPKGWEVKALGDLCDDLFLGLTSAVEYIDDTNGFPLVRAKDINTGELSFDDVKYISVEQHKKLTKNHLTKRGDLLVSKSGTLGTCAIVRTDREFSTYESIFTVRPSKSKLDIHYLIHLLQNKGFKEKLIGNKVGGTVAHLNLKMFRDFNIGIPPIEVQKMFSEKIVKCEQKIERYKRSECEANNFFNSLSQKAFSGNL